MPETHFTKADDSHAFTVAFLREVHFVEKIAIIGHMGPDDDSIASTLAMHRMLTDMNPNIEVDMLCNGEVIEDYAPFQHYDKLKYLKDISRKFDEYNVLVFVDGAQYHRFTKHPEKLKDFEGKMFCIDHHASPIDEFDMTLIDADMPANTEVIYRAFGDYLSMDKELAEVFLLGLLGDTGNMMYLKPTQLGTMKIVRELLEIAGVEIQEFQAQYRTYSPDVMQLIKKFMINTKFNEVEGWPAFQTSHVDEKDIEDGGYSENDVSLGKHIYMSQYVRAINNHPWGFVANAKGDEVRVSFRSLPGSVNVRDVAERMNIGGGHDRAAGGSFNRGDGPKAETAKDAIKEISTWLKKNPQELSENEDS